MPYEDPNWPRASKWLEGSCSELLLGSVALIDAPLNWSISPGSCDKAPAAVRAAMHRLSTFDIEAGIDAAFVNCIDMGVVQHGERPEDAFDPIKQSVIEGLKKADAAILLGGDNGITRPAVHGLGLPLEKCGLVTLDQHFDLRTLEGGLINGNPVSALLDDGLPGHNIAQIGISSFANSKAYADLARREQINVVTMDTVHEMGIESIVSEVLEMMPAGVEAIHFDLDVDVLDSAFAPACPGARPGGLTPHQARKAAHLMGLDPRVISMDLVEIDPDKDIGDRTALAAGSFLLSFVTGLALRLGSAQ
jgi:formiminoglutamase